MSLFDIVKKNTDVLVDSDNSMINKSLRYDKRKKTLKGRTSDGQGNAYLFEANPSNGILVQQKVTVPLDRDNISQAKYLKAQGYTQDEIADMLGVSQSTVSNWLRK